MAFTETIIDLIRHGEPEGGHKFRGTLDDPLSEIGWQQMRESLGEYNQWTRLVSSPLSRCHAFADELKQNLGLEPNIIDDFREIDFGAWEGLTMKELMAREPDALRNYWQNPEQHAPAGAEKMSKFIERVHSAWDQLIEQNHGKHTLLVCHGGVIRAVLVRVLGMPNGNLWNFDVPYANVSRVVYHRFPDGGQTAQLRFHQRQLP